MIEILIGGTPHSDGDSEVVGLVVLEVSNDEGQEVGRHDGCLVVCDGLALLASNLGVNLFFGSNIHVTQADQVLVSNQSDGECRLESRLVETGECSASISSLELGGGDVLCVALLVLV